MPNRIIRDGILQSEAVAELSWAEEVFYRRLMSVVDDYGRYHALPKLLRAACYPLQIDKVSDSDIGKWIAGCVNAGLVRVYSAKDGKSYLEIVKFGQRVQSKSKFPEPPVISGEEEKDIANPPCSTVNNRLDGDGDGDDTCTKQQSCIPADDSPVVASLPLVDGCNFNITQAQVDGWAPAYPGIDIGVQLHKARVWLESNPKKRKTRTGIARFVTSWLGRAQDSGRDYSPAVKAGSKAPEVGLGTFV